jgi:transcriptional regulator with XRE-family HTH domain
MSDASSDDYARLIGERLRAIRRQRGWSLRNAGDASGAEFSPSAIGTYERGERGLSIERLHRLARLYRVPVDRLLPEEGSAVRRDEEGPVADIDQVVIDLAALEHHREDRGLEPLRRYVAVIQGERQDWNGRMLSMRRGDLRTLARLAGTDLEQTRRRLDGYGLLRH